MGERPEHKTHSLKNLVQRFSIFPSGITPRLLLFFVAVLLQLLASAFSGVGYTLNISGYWIAGIVFWLIWFFLMFLIAAPQTDILLQQYRVVLKRGAVLIFTVLFIVGIGEVIVLGILAPWFLNNGIDNDVDKLVTQMYDGFRLNDGTALSQQATENLLEGNEPYSNANIVTAITKYNGAVDRLTPLRVGAFSNDFPYPSPEKINQVWANAIQNPSRPPIEIESRVCYPAGSFLLQTPLIAAGMNDIRIIYIIFVIAGLIYVIWLIPGKKRFLFMGITLISLELWNTLAIGETSIIIFPLLLIAWVTLGKNNWVSAIFMGLAVASKQTAWFFLPFYIILMSQTTKPKVTAAAIGIIALVFIAINGYFIAQSPSLWLQSITAPVVEPMFPLGVGFVSLVYSGLVGMQSSLPFTIAEGVIFIGSVIWYMRYGKKYPDVGPILAILPLFFAWRSIWTYFYYIAIIVLARMLTQEENTAVKLAPRAR